jgi:hypothetical protein
MNNRTNITSIRPLHFARQPKARTLLGWFVNWKRDGKDSAVFVYRGEDGQITSVSLPLEQIAAYQKSEITEEEARQIDPEIVLATSKKYQQTLREVLLTVLGEKANGPAVESPFVDTHYVEVQKLYIESLALFDVIEQLVHEMTQEGEENEQRKQQYVQVGRIAHAYRGYCLKDLLDWLQMLVTTQADLFPLPVEQKMKLVLMLNDPQLEPALQRELAEVALSIDTRRSDVEQGQQQ